MRMDCRSCMLHDILDASQPEAPVRLLPGRFPHRTTLVMMQQSQMRATIGGVYYLLRKDYIRTITDHYIALCLGSLVKNKCN